MFGMPVESQFLLSSTSNNGETIEILRSGKRYIINEDGDLDRELTPLDSNQIKQLRNALKDGKWEEIEKFTRSNISQVEKL